MFQADCVISIPKLKTHRYCGFTCALKNFVGVVLNKEALPHFSKGSIAEGGNEYLNKSKRKQLFSYLDEISDNPNGFLKRWIIFFLKGVIFYSDKIKRFKDPYFGGAWFGNDTASKMVLDLNSAIFFHLMEDKQKLKSKPNFLFIVDAIKCGEGDGPLNPTEKQVGAFLIGTHPVYVDLAAVTLMGFDYQLIPIFRLWVENRKKYENEKSMDEIKFSYNGREVSLDQLKQSNQNFLPSSGWKSFLRK